MAVVSGFRTVCQPLGRRSREHCAVTAGSRSLAARRPPPPQFPQRPFKKPSITPPLRGSRRDKGAARSRSGGGQTRRPVRADRQHSQSHQARRSSSNGTRCPKAAPAPGPPPHQPSPFGSASATPPQGGSDTGYEEGTEIVRWTGNMVYILPRNRARSPEQASRITPPLRGSRRDKGSARSRSGGGQNAAPRDWSSAAIVTSEWRPLRRRTAPDLDALN